LLEITCKVITQISPHTALEIKLKTENSKNEGRGAKEKIEETATRRRKVLLSGLTRFFCPVFARFAAHPEEERGRERRTQQNCKQKRAKRGEFLRKSEARSRKKNARKEN
jgi:hypothetical protein